MSTRVVSTINPVLAACYIGNLVTVRRGTISGVLLGVGETGVWIQDPNNMSFDGMTYHPYPVEIRREE